MSRVRLVSFSVLLTLEDPLRSVIHIQHATSFSQADLEILKGLSAGSIPSSRPLELQPWQMVPVGS